MNSSSLFQESNDSGEKFSTLPIYDNPVYDDEGIIFDTPIYMMMMVLSLISLHMMMIYFMDYWR